MTTVAETAWAKSETDPVRAVLADDAAQVQLLCWARCALRASGSSVPGSVLNDYAAELVSRMAVIALEKRTQYDSARATVITWLCGIITTLAKARKSKAERERGHGGSDAIIEGALANDPSPTETAVERADRQRVRRALSMLAPIQQQLLRGKYYDQLTDTLLADQLGLSRSNVRVMIHRAIRELRTMLDADAEGLS